MIVNRFVPNQEVFEKGIGNIKNINNINNTENVDKTSESFSATLKGALDSLNDKQITADNMINAFIKGDDVEISDVMLASEEAKLSLQFAVQVRNKLVDAYKEISQIQL